MMSSWCYSRLGKLIGQGQFGDVHKGMWIMNHEIAVKVLNKSAQRRDHIRFLRECYVMSQFDHTNIVKLLGVVSQGNCKTSVSTVIHMLHAQSYSRYTSLQSQWMYASTIFNSLSCSF